MISLTGKRQTWNKAEIGSIDQNCAEKSCFQAIALQKYVMMQVKAPNSSLDEIYAYKKNMYIKRNIISFMNSNKCALSQNQEMCRRVGNKIAKAFFFLQLANKWYHKVPHDFRSFDKDNKHQNYGVIASVEFESTTGGYHVQIDARSVKDNKAWNPIINFSIIYWRFSW